MKNEKRGTSNQPADVDEDERANSFACGPGMKLRLFPKEQQQKVREKEDQKLRKRHGSLLQKPHGGCEGGKEKPNRGECQGKARIGHGRCVGTSLKRVSFGSFGMGNSAQQTSQEPVHRRHPMAQPDRHRLRLCAQGRFGLESGAAEREPFAAPFNRVVDGCVKETQVQRQPFARGGTVETDIPGDGCVAIAYRRHKPKDFILAPDHCAAKILAGCGRQGRDAGIP